MRSDWRIYDVNSKYEFKRFEVFLYVILVYGHYYFDELAAFIFRVKSGVAGLSETLVTVSV